MKANAETVVVGEKVILVPYLASHVPQYHEWMSNGELRELTASEPLTLEEEYAMQHAWLRDEDKLTFIVLAKSGEVDVLNGLDRPSLTGSVAQASPMIGDVNIFLKGKIPEVTGGHLAFLRPTVADEGEELEEPFEAEVEVMIAELAYRRKGYAQETLELMLQYATGAPVAYFRRSHDAEITPGQTQSISPQMKSPLNIPPSCLVVRISETNEPSIRLFEKVGFTITKRVAVFQEIEMRWFHP